ncbi:hypothetical protein D0863_01168 [Hortaea werneckii]|uniref:MOSC domain-containing protein n=1 Tax=Hortaea werneckii TaxID=91943 RepID=A0A3M7EM49_HORWE|nr:hypothetical protein D0863_01168 [Hortaea werneckii]
MATPSALFEHYLEYLTNPGVTLSLVLIVLPILFGSYSDTFSLKAVRSTRVPGCLRLGLKKKSNLEDQYHDQDVASGSKPTVKALFTYPVKSARGVELAASEVQRSGLKYDRMFTFAQLASQAKNAEQKDGAFSEVSHEWDHQWQTVTQREIPRLALLETELWLPDPRNKPDIPAHIARGRSRLNPPSEQSRSRSRPRGDTLELERGRKDPGAPEVSSWVANGGCLIIRFPFEPDFNPFGLRTETVTLHLPLMPTPQRRESKRYERDELFIHGDAALALNVSNEIDARDLQKLKYFLGVSNPLGLFRVDEHRLRSVKSCIPPDAEHDDYKIAFADSFPIGMTGLSSIRAIENQLPAESKAKSRLDARRFRANIYATGIEAFEEDEWMRTAIGRRIGGPANELFEEDAEYHVACRSTCSSLQNFDPDTGVKDKNEPYETLKSSRKAEKELEPCLGVQLIPTFHLGIIKVGDEIGAWTSQDDGYPSKEG